MFERWPYSVPKVAEVFLLAGKSRILHDLTLFLLWFVLLYDSMSVCLEYGCVLKCA